MKYTAVTDRKCVYLIGCLQKTISRFLQLLRNSTWCTKKVALGVKEVQPTEELLLKQKLRDFILLAVEVVDTISLHFSLPSGQDKSFKIVSSFQIIYYIL